MDISERTPRRRRAIYNPPEFLTPPMQMSLCKELKAAINERNLLTVKSRNKVCRMLDNDTDSPFSSPSTNEINRRDHLRRQAIEEILTSEKSYLNQLQILMDYFVSPLKNILTPSVHTLLFGQIEMIYNLNGELLSELEMDLDNVAEAFIKLAPFFKLYSVYAFDFKQSLLTLQDLSTRNQAFKRFLLNTESRPEVSQKLNSLLIVPIQRVPRYRLLLQQVLLYTTPSDPDYKILQDSIKQIENTATHIDSVVEDQENTQKLISLQNSLVSRMPVIVKPSRKILKEGILTRVSSNGVQLKRYCILMSDIFMYCKILKERPHNIEKENSLKCSCIFPLKKCKVTEIFPGHFKLSCSGDGIILSTSDVNLGRSWVSTLKQSIEYHIECRKTLRKESSKRKPLRNKRDVEKFEINEILSPNSKKKIDEFDKIFLNDSESEMENIEWNCFKQCTTNKLLKRNYPNEIKSILTKRKIREESNRKQNDYMDVLYPLRESTGSENSKAKKNENDEENEENDDEDEVVIPKKRVKFELDKNRYDTDELGGYKFPYDCQTPIFSPALTIGQRIRKFFQNLL